MLLPTTITLAEPSFKTPVSSDVAEQRANALLARLTVAQKLQLISGHNSFFIKGYPELGIPELYMSDATGGVNIRRNLSTALEKSTAFPNPLALAATWNPALAYRYAHSIGEECRAGGIAFLLGPGMNLYRHAQAGRNFEYFGEDPLLSAKMIERYVAGVLDTGTIPTLKHFLANETDHYRRTSNSIVDERTLHEIYLPPFRAGIEAGAMAVMTSYNLLNGEWCGQSRSVITELLREQLGYKWLVMTDWWSVWDAQKIIESGQDLEMPGEKFIKADADRLLKAGKVTEVQIDRMARSILRTCIAMGLHDRPVQDTYFLEKFPEHEQVALQTAREGIVLLKNDGVLPVRRESGQNILFTGRYAQHLPRGLGAAEVQGYDPVPLLQELQDTYGAQLHFVAAPTDEEIRAADIVFLSTGTEDSEGWDRPFALPDAEEQRIQRIVGLNPRTVVIVNTGSGIQMTGWNDRAAAVVWAWYPGQIGNRALAEILCGETNPSGKLPITIERRFEDSPGFGYLPAGESLYVGWDQDNNMSHPVTRVVYQEGVFIGYRWYEQKQIAPLYAFGHGLSYTTFAYSDLKLSEFVMPLEGRVSVEFTVTNTGLIAGTEIAQLYVRDTHAPLPRPPKELKAFSRVSLQPGESRVVRFRLTAKEFAYWDVAAHAWRADPRDYTLLVGGASDRIALEAKLTLQ
ncbi:beta-glucosidase [Opitutus terrae]|uniref:Glycoside hydrolase family 3 domain protein n=1 Tax=Opitutus terrae (strain DSM 11246 / JCM 15787 / PB90-1) TaxID=452637 RepID=B1ZQ80_OPITP|nr:glycoside hydrolase family 3 C-terminal domain-containing protein [Opitutus terrae]ACB73560.1 glycoside hydrolase family 3 domain protein [Opitutus terrae PB90-1]